MCGKYARSWHAGVCKFKLGQRVFLGRSNTTLYHFFMVGKIKGGLCVFIVHKEKKSINLDLRDSDLVSSVCEANVSLTVQCCRILCVQSNMENV